MENSKTVAQTLLGETAHFGYFHQNRLFWGVWGGPRNFIFMEILIFFVTEEPLQNFKTVAQTLLGETAHFGFCPPKIGFLGG